MTSPPRPVSAVERLGVVVDRRRDDGRQPAPLTAPADTLSGRTAGSSAAGSGNFAGRGGAGAWRGDVVTAACGALVPTANIRSACRSGTPDLICLGRTGVWVCFKDTTAPGPGARRHWNAAPTR